jgi:aminopeptidase N
MLDRRNQPIMTEPDRIGSDGLGYLAYGKPGYALTLLRDYVLGETVEESRSRFDTAMRAYVKRWSYKHPQPWDFFRTIEDVTGEDLAWFWRGWFYGTGVLDQVVGDVTVEDGIATVLVDHKDQMVMPVLWQAGFADGTVERGRVPAEAFATGEGGKVVLDVSERELVSFVIDPDGVMPEVSRADNAWGG